MYTTDKATERQVEKEQEQIKHTGQKALHAVKKVKAGEVNVAELPTTDRVSDVLERGERALEFLQKNERVQLGAKGQLVLDDVQRVLQDEVILLQKNEGDIIQNIVKHGVKLTEALSGEPSFKTIFENWHSLSQSVASGDIKGLVSSGGELMKTLKDTEQFLDLASELIDVLKMFIAEKTDEVVEGKSHVTQADKDAERDRIISTLRGILHSISNNYIWSDMLRRGKLVANTKGKKISEEVKKAGEEVKEEAEDVLDKALHSENARCLGEDLRVLLQRLAGDSVDVDPLFDFSKAAWHNITHDKELSSVLYELEDDLQQIAKHPTLADDPLIKNSLKLLSQRAEFAVKSLKSNPNVVGVKKESQKVVDAIKNNPTSQQLVQDVKKLWTDIRSDNQGEFLDPTLLADLRQVVIPIFLEHLEHVPIPAIQDTTDFLGKYDYTLDNIHVSVPALIPDDVHIRINCDIEADPMKLEAHNKRTFILLEAKDIHIHLHEVAWSYTRRSIPHLHDSGFADIDTQGHGVSIKMKMEVRRDLSEKHVLDVLGVRVQIDKWEVKIAESKHDFIYKALAHMFGSKIRRQVETSIEAKLKEFGSTANDQLITILNQARTSSHDFKHLATEKFAQVKESAKETAKKTKDKAAEKLPAGEGDVKEVANEVKEVAEEVKEEVKEEVEEQGRGLLTIAAEKACEILTRQQEKIDQRHAHLTLGHQRKKAASSLTNSALLSNSMDSLAVSMSIPPTPPPSPINSDNLQNSTMSLSESSVIPTAEVEAYTPYAWGEAPPPSLGFEIYPDLPSISGGDVSDVKSDVSECGSEANFGGSVEPEANVVMQKQPAIRIFNEQGEVINP